MTLDQFKDKYEGQTKGYPTDSQYKGECLSIVKLYLKECFGFNPPASGSNSAHGYWYNFPSPLPQFFNKVMNTFTAIPKPGDIIIWNEETGKGFGHIEIVVEATQSSFKSFGQNWNGKHAHMTTHNYDNVLGWLSPINSQEPSMDYQKLYEQARKARDNWWLNQVKLFNAILPDIEFKEQSADSQVVGAINTLKEERKESESLRNNVRTLEKEMAVQNTQFTDEINKLIEEKEVLQTKLDLIQRGLLNPVPEPVQEQPKPIEEKPEIPQEEPQKEEYSSLISLILEVLKVFGLKITKKE